MALNRVLASLSVLLGSDTKGFEKGMQKGKGELQAFADQAKKMATIAASAFAAVTAAAVLAANKAAEYADKIDKASISTGLSRESLQKLTYVADQAGVEFETLTNSFKQLTRNASEASIGAQRQKETFAKLGVSVTDTNGALKDMEQIFPEVISALSKIENETERNATAFNIFGEEAFKVIPRLVELGDEGFAALQEKAEKLHLVMSDQGIATLVRYKDNMSTVKQQFGAIVREGIVPFAAAFTDKLVPVLSSFLEKISIWQQSRLVEQMQREQTELNSLVTALMSANDNERLRSGLITEIKDKYPDFLKGLSDEETTVSNLRDRLKEANDQYKERITLLAIEAEAQKASSKGVSLKMEERELAKQMASRSMGGQQFGFTPPDTAPIFEFDESGKKQLIDDMNKVAEYFANLEYSEVVKNPSKAGQSYVEGLRKLGSRYLEIQSEVEENAKLHAELIIESQKVTQYLNDLISQSGDLTGNTKTSSTTSTTGGGPNPKPKAISPMSSFAAPGAGTQMNPMAGFQQATVDLTAFADKLKEVKPIIMDFSQSLQSAFTDMAVSFGESIGNMISGTADMGNFFDVIKDSFGKFAQQMGQLIIAYGFSMIAFKKALGNPIAAIVAGAALVAVGTVIRNSASSPNLNGGASPASATGAYTGSPSGGGSGVERIELIWKRAGKDMVALIEGELNTRGNVTGNPRFRTRNSF